MKSLGWGLLLLDWYSLRKGHLDSQRNTRGALATEYIHTHRGESYENTVGSWTPANQEKSPPKKQTLWHLYFGLSSLQNCEKKFMLFMSPSVWYFVMAALTK